MTTKSSAEIKCLLMDDFLLDVGLVNVEKDSLRNHAETVEGLFHCSDGDFVIKFFSTFTASSWKSDEGEDQSCDGFDKISDKENR